MSNLFSSPIWSIGLTILAYLISKHIFIRTKLSICNPLLLSIIFIIFILSVFSIPLKYYQIGGDIINLFITPATAVLALPIYKQLSLLKKHFIPVLLGCFVGSLTSLISVYLLCYLFSIPEVITLSLLPKSVTTPFAIEISEQLQGIPSITIAVVVITGVLGSLLCPMLLPFLPFKNAIATGTGFGACSHAVGTTKALEYGEIEGAMSGIAIGLTGILTVLLTLFLSCFI